MTPRFATAFTTLAMLATGLWSPPGASGASLFDHEAAARVARQVPGTPVPNGEGYLMLMAARMANMDPNAQFEFDSLWAHCRAMREGTCDGANYIPLALAIAEAQWGNAGRFHYGAELRGFLAASADEVLGLGVLLGDEDTIFANGFEFAELQTLTVGLAGAGTGTVTSAPAGINCGMACTASFAPGTEVTLTATAATSPESILSKFTGWTGGGCSGTGTCVVTITAATTVTADFALEPNFAFVTSTVHNGNLGGIAGADTICQARAMAAGRPGTYRAWLSTSTTTAISRLSGASGWIRIDGRPFVNTTSDLANQRLFTPLRITELNTDIGSATAHTATVANGTRDPNSVTCNEYTSSVTAGFLTGGMTDGQGSLWTQGIAATCSTPSRLFCFGINRAASVTPTPPAGGFRRAFTSSMPFVPGGGLAAADAICNSEASSAGLPGTYRALLATMSASAASRFSTTAGSLPWGRPDGQLCAPTAAGFFSLALLDSAPNTTANLDTYLGNFGNWGGAGSVNVPGDTPSTCGNWTTSGSGGSGGRVGYTLQTRRFTGDIFGCDANFVRVTCLQQ